jgi:hypothetical protein
MNTGLSPATRCAFKLLSAVVCMNLWHLLPRCRRNTVSLSLQMYVEAIDRNVALPAPCDQSCAAICRHQSLDRIVGEQRIAGEIHLRHDARDERMTEHREVDMSRPPRILMIAPWIRTRLDGHEPVVTVALTAIFKCLSH